MDASPDIWTSVVNYWNTLREGTRDNIIGGLLVAVVLALVAIFRKALLAGVKRIFRPTPEQLQSPTKHEVVIKVETAPPAPPPPQSSSDSHHQDPTPHEAASLIPRPPVVGFVSRRDEQGHDIVKRLKEELAPGRNQMVTLSGAGGLGKTTLAAEAARGLQAAYDGRVTWSSADGRPDFTLLSLLDDIATQLGRAELRTLAPAAKEEQVRALVTAPPALVTLDNCETISEAEHKRIETWFAQTRCSALFTSRQSVAGTVFVRISAMSHDEAAEFLKRLTEQTHDPQLFTPEVRGRVYETAEANPFVMQWVVGQIDLAQEPGAVLEELKHGEGDAARRVFDRSFELPLLGSDGRDALLALSLFAPSATAEALSAVAGFDDEGRVREAVKNLRRLWLVKGVDGNRRLAVEGLTRTLAGAHLSRDPRADEFRRRFVAYFLRYAEERKEPTPENYDALEEEKDNLLGAAEAAFSSGDRQSVMRMAYALGNAVDGMLSMRGYWDEALRLGEQALKAIPLSKDETGISWLSYNTAVMYHLRGELDEAQRLYADGLEIDRRLGDHKGIALTTWALGNLSLNQGDLDEAKRQFDEALGTFRTLDDQANMAGVLNQLGGIAYEKGAYTEAQRLYSESLEVSEKLGKHRNASFTLHNLGVLAQEQGDLVEARRLYSKSLKIKRKLGDQSGIASTLYQLGRIAELESDRAQAARLFGQALDIWIKLGSPNVEMARESLARVEGESS